MAANEVKGIMILSGPRTQLSGYIFELTCINIPKRSERPPAMYRPTPLEQFTIATK